VGRVSQTDIAMALLRGRSQLLQKKGRANIAGIMGTTKEAVTRSWATRLTGARMAEAEAAGAVEVDVAVGLLAVEDEVQAGKLRTLPWHKPTNQEQPRTARQKGLKSAYWG